MWYVTGFANYLYLYTSNFMTLKAHNLKSTKAAMYIAYTSLSCVCNIVLTALPFAYGNIIASPLSLQMRYLYSTCILTYWQRSSWWRMAILGRLVSQEWHPLWGNQMMSVILNQLDLMVRVEAVCMIYKTDMIIKLYIGGIPFSYCTTMVSAPA